MNEIHKPEQQLDNPELKQKSPESLRENEAQLKKYGAELDNAKPELEISDGADKAPDKVAERDNGTHTEETAQSKWDRLGEELDAASPMAEEVSSHDNAFMGLHKKEYVPEPVARMWQENKEHINNEVLPVADAEVKSHMRSNGLDAYVVSRDKLDSGLAGSTKALTPTEMQTEYGRNWSSNINGFNNGRESFIDSRLNPEQAKETAIHEYYHYLSANDTYKWNGRIADTKRGISINGQDCGLNEALTQKYTVDTMRDSDPSYKNPQCAYHDAARYVDKLYSCEGNKEMFDTAYFQNNPDILRQHFDGCCGEGFYDRLSQNFDVITAGENGGYTLEERNIAACDIETCIYEYKLRRTEENQNENL